MNSIDASTENHRRVQTSLTLSSNQAQVFSKSCENDDSRKIEELIPWVHLLEPCLNHDHSASYTHYTAYLLLNKEFSAP